MSERGQEHAIRPLQVRRAGLLALQEAELLPKQGDLQILGSLAVAARRKQVKQEREELRGERPGHRASGSICGGISTAY
jgi:hypothetical protein